MAFSSIDGILTKSPVTVPESLEVLLPAIYQQTLGNAYVMESERDELIGPESQFCRTGDVRTFVRSIACSELYKSRFFYSVSQYRFIELAYKHILARAPGSKEEYAEAMAVYHSHGYESLIDYFVDSPEYAEDFKEYVVPYGIYKGVYPSNQQFNRSVAMRLTPSQSDKGRSSMLQYCVLSGDSPNWLSISKGLPAGTERGTGFVVASRHTSTQRNKNSPVRIGTKIPGGVVFY